MNRIAHLDEWLAALQPSLGIQPLGFLHWPHPLRGAPLDGLVQPVAYLEDQRGVTFVVPLDDARRAGFEPRFACSRLELGVDTPLEGVGFLAVIATALAAAGIAANPFAGFYRDTLFVPVDRAEQALHVLRQLAADARARLDR